MHLLYLKIPYLIFDFLALYFFVKLFEGKREKMYALIFWVLNPVSLYASYLIGQHDIIPTFFVILALYFIKKNSKNSLVFASLALGFGAVFKIYPLLLLPVVFALAPNIKQRILVLMCGIVPYILLVIPFINSKGFRTNALVASQTTKSLYAQIPISGGEAIILFIVVLFFFYLLFMNIKIVKDLVWQRFFIVVLIFFVFTHYHPQWFLLLTPFLIIEIIKSNFKNIWALTLSLFSFSGLLFFFDPSLTLGLFAPIYPDLIKTPSLWEFLRINMDYNFARSVLQTIFVSAAAYYIYQYFPKKEFKGV